MKRRYFSVAAFPNLITLFNLFSGFLSILMVMHDRYDLGVWLIILGLVWDSLDGHVARIFENTTDFGRELDSLADIVTFVVAPCILAVSMLFIRLPMILFAVALFYLGTGAYRLARYNVESSGKKSFDGLPTPASAVSLAMLLLTCHHQGWTAYPICCEIITLMMFGMGFLMISHIPYPKFSAVKFGTWRYLFYVMIGLFVLVFLLFNLETAVTSVFLAYLFVAPVFCIFNRDLLGPSPAENPPGASI
jgi:CDP-diacylglycerol--serine O-phosphatidyltransferase